MLRVCDSYHVNSAVPPQSSPAYAGLSGKNQLTLLWPPPSYGGGAGRVEGDRISGGDCNIRTSRYIGCFGISCRAKIEVVERPPPVPLRPCGPPPPYDGGGLRFLSRQRLDRQQIIGPQGSNRLRPTFLRTALRRGRQS